MLAWANWFGRANMNGKRPLLYIAGPYRAETPEGVQANVLMASRYGLHFAAKGWAPVVPHALTWKLAELDTEKRMSDGAWLDITMEFALMCDAAFFCEGWEDSRGATAERKALEDEHVACFDAVEDVPDGADFWDWCFSEAGRNWHLS